MAERRKNKKKKEIDNVIDQPPAKEEYAVAKYLKSKLPEKKTTFAGHKVDYFIASKAVDCLLESHWAKKEGKSDVHFQNRDAVVKFMERLLVHKFFHRAKKIVVIKEQKKKKDEGSESSKSKDKDGEESKKPSEHSDKKEKKKEKVKESEADETKKSSSDKKDKKKKDKTSSQPEKKERKKIKLDMHRDQIFVDKNEPYVWIYDPIPLKSWITGAVMVLAAVLISLFPLWPQVIRHYIYYLSVALAFFLVFIIGLVVVRFVIFIIIWILTLGKHHLWILPNLTEDCGFFESFWPLYHYEYKGKVKDSDREKSKAKEDKEIEKESDDRSEESSSDNEKKHLDAKNSESEDSGDERDKMENENDFEMINADDVTSSDNEDPKTK